MRLAWIVIVIACAGHGMRPPDANSDPAVCMAEREAAIDRTCNAPTDCVLVASADCCGTVMIAVRAGTEAGFPAVEAAYEACLACPPLGCHHADLAEDGTVPGPGESIVATCTQNRCASVAL